MGFREKFNQAKAAAQSGWEAVREKVTPAVDTFNMVRQALPDGRNDLGRRPVEYGVGSRLLNAVVQMDLQREIQRVESDPRFAPAMDAYMRALVQTDPTLTQRYSPEQIYTHARMQTRWEFTSREAATRPVQTPVEQPGNQQTYQNGQPVYEYRGDPSQAAQQPYPEPGNNVFVIPERVNNDFNR